MPITVRADLFWVNVEGQASDLVRLLRQYFANQEDDPVVFTSNSIKYRADSLDWQNSPPRLTGTLYKARSGSLPSQISPEGITPLDLEEDTDLGEPMCFAFFPNLHVVAIQFANAGPRHGRFKELISHLGYDQPISLSPVLKTDTAERLRDATVIRKMEFGLEPPEGEAQHQALERSTGGALSLNQHFGGVKVRITVSMGYEDGSLVVPTVKRACERLLQMGSAVGTLKLNAGEEGDIEPIDLLHDRLYEKLQVQEAGREMDKDNCCRNLVAFVERHEASIRRQLRQQ